MVCTAGFTQKWRHDRNATGLVLAVALFLAGCETHESQQPEFSPQTPPFRIVLDEHELMAHVLDPAADVIWASAGAVITADGETDLAPTTDAGWLAVENAAALLIEAGNLLLLPGRAPDQGDWQEYSLALSHTAERALAAADARDADALFDIGGQLYNICLACHQAYDDRTANDANP